MTSRKINVVDRCGSGTPWRSGTGLGLFVMCFVISKEVMVFLEKLVVRREDMTWRKRYWCDWTRCTDSVTDGGCSWFERCRRLRCHRPDFFSFLSWRRRDFFFVTYSSSLSVLLVPRVTYLLCRMTSQSVRVFDIQRLRWETLSLKKRMSQRVSFGIRP